MYIEFCNAAGASKELLQVASITEDRGLLGTVRGIKICGGYGSENVRSLPVLYEVFIRYAQQEAIRADNPLGIVRAHGSDYNKLVLPR